MPTTGRSTQAEMVAKFANTWSSKRLIYQPLENNDKCKNLIYKVFDDPIANGLGMPSIPKPTTRAMVDEYASGWPKKTLLSVIICLPPKRKPATADTTTKTDSDDKAGGDDDKEPEAEPIGFIQMAKRLEFSGSIALGILPDYQDKGYGRECINWITDWGFRSANLHTINIGTVSFNERALHLYRDIGFVDEGVQREVVYLEMEWFDLVELGMLRDEWMVLRGLK